jgi:glycosyltransferase involved in cell wall biosynthesis
MSTNNNIPTIMKNEIISVPSIDTKQAFQKILGLTSHGISLLENKETIREQVNELSEILVVTSYPPRECGIATYSQDLIKAINNKFSNSLSIKVCAIESGETNYSYPGEVKYTLKTSIADEYEKLAIKINKNNRIKLVLIQHEFGLYKDQENAFMQFLFELTKPVAIVFHTVLPHPDDQLKLKMKHITSICQSIIVMTHSSAEILSNEYNVPQEKISVIAHGTHLVPHLNETNLKLKYGLKDRKVLTTFGLLSSGKGIETTLAAMPAIVRQCPDVMFMVLGKTHPEVVKNDGEKYREMLIQTVTDLGLVDHVTFINKYLSLPELLEYLQLTDIYLFTATDPNQAVSGTFAYAMSCGCPIISTPIPHARELLNSDTGIIFDFRNAEKLAESAIYLLKNDSLRKKISVNALQKIVSTAWENSAVEHAFVLGKIADEQRVLKYNLPPINFDHLQLMTTQIGIIQFSKINQPDISSGYTLDDNARALIAGCMYFRLTGDEKSIFYIQKYLSFIKFCQQPSGSFLNYVNKENHFTDQNKSVNLDDSNGRAIWALGYLISLIDVLPAKIILEADRILFMALHSFVNVHSTRAMAFAIKGLYYYQHTMKTDENLPLIKTLANRLVQMYKHESSKEWEWFESYLTYANSIMPEAMLYAWMLTGEIKYREIAKSSLDFLLSHTFNENGIEVISNRNWSLKGEKAEKFGEQPIDVAYTIMTLSKFYDVFADEKIKEKMLTAFNWFLGKNRLHQIVYNPCTGGCYDGLEETHVNLNQGAESTISYLMARLTIEKYNK